MRLHGISRGRYAVLRNARGLRRMAGAIGFKPTTSCAQVLVARTFNNLQAELRNATECYRSLISHL